MYGRLLADFYNTFFDVTAQDTTQFWCLMAIQFISALIPLCFMWLIPTREDVNKVQQHIHEEEVVFKDGVKRFNSRIMRQAPSGLMDLTNSFSKHEERLQS